MKKLAQGFNTAAQDSNPGSRSRDPEALSLSHCAWVFAHAVVCSYHFISRDGDDI